jgi:hypothetical protein
MPAGRARTPRTPRASSLTGGFDYAVYGLRLRADRALPHLVPAPKDPADRSPDVRLELDCDLRRSAPADGTVLRYAETEDEVVEFVISRDGTRIWCEWSEATSAGTVNDLTGLLTGAVLGTALRLRGAISLHGSAVLVGDRAVAILAEQGVGKSTLAAALAGRGHAVLSDDVVALSEASDGWTVRPGYPRLRLTDEAVAALELDASDRVFTGQEKRYLRLGGSEAEDAPSFGSEPARLGAIYELARGTDPPVALEPLRGAERLTALLRHRSARQLRLDPARQAAELRSLGALAGSVPVRRLVRPQGLEDLPAVCAAIEDDAAS